jgi:hypothetical protein
MLGFSADDAGVTSNKILQINQSFMLDNKNEQSKVESVNTEEPVQPPLAQPTITVTPVALPAVTMRPKKTSRSRSVVVSESKTISEPNSNWNSFDKNNISKHRSNKKQTKSRQKEDILAFDSEAFSKLNKLMTVEKIPASASAKDVDVVSQRQKAYRQFLVDAAANMQARKAAVINFNSSETTDTQFYWILGGLFAAFLVFYYLKQK